MEAPEDLILEPKFDAEERKPDLEKVDESLSYVNPFRKRLDERNQEVLVQIFRAQGDRSFEQKTLRKLLDDILSETGDEINYKSDIKNEVMKMSLSDYAVPVPRMRDLRMLDFALNATEDHLFLVRKDAIILSLDQIRGVITSKRLIVVVPPGGMDNVLETIGEYISAWSSIAGGMTDGSRSANKGNNNNDSNKKYSDEDALEYRRRQESLLSPEVPFEAHALEAILTIADNLHRQEYKKINEETQKVLNFFSKTSSSAIIIPYTVQEKMLTLKNALTRLQSDLQDYNRSLTALIEDDDAMALMNLTVLRQKPFLYKKPLSAEILRMHDEVEEMLQAHLIDCTSLSSEVAYVIVSIQNAEDSLSLKLDVAQNRVLVTNTTFQGALVMIGFGGYISGIFGMNLDNTITIQPIYGVFEIVFVGTFALMVFGSYALWKYFEARGVIPKYVTRRNLLRKQKRARSYQSVWNSKMFSSRFRRSVIIGGSISVGLIIGYTVASQTVNSPSEKETKKKKIVIIGGGTGGVFTSSILAGEGYENVTVIDPEPFHFYQPLWTLVGAGIKENTKSVRPISSVIHSNVTLVPQAAVKIVPKKNEVILDDGSKASYDYLIVATGLEHDWNAVPGLAESVGKPETGVTSIFDYNHSATTWDQIQDFKGGRAIFTMPRSVIKCAGAPQKIMWLFEDYIRTRTADKTLREKTSVEFWAPGMAMFGVKKYSDMLEKERDSRGVKSEFGQELVKVDGSKKIATFKSVKDGKIADVKYDFLHVVPHMSVPEFIRKSHLADANGYLDVDKHTLQSKKHKNIFGLGDCTNTPNSKTVAAILSQGPVLLHNLKQEMNGKPLDGHYDGYGSCPLLVSRDRTILAEFGYDGKIMETFARDTGLFPLKYMGQTGVVQERLFTFMKTDVFPFVYWNLMPRGMWYGKYCIFCPNVTKRGD